MYKRVLIKLSGQQLAGKYEGGFDADLAGWFAEEIKPLNKKGIQIVIMVGGGNIVRGKSLRGTGITPVAGEGVEGAVNEGDTPEFHYRDTQTAGR